MLSCTKDKSINTSFNPVKLWLDNNNEHINAYGGSFLIYENSYYWFGEQKVSEKESNKAMLGVGVYSSKDLYNWKNEGIALSISKGSNSKLTRSCILKRPKVIFNKITKKFVMWFHHELKGQDYAAALTGVAVANKVSGPYHYIDSFRIHTIVLPLNFSQEDFNNAPIIKDRKNENWKDKVIKGAIFKRDFEVGLMSRDKTLFVDDDETTYHITASEEN